MCECYAGGAVNPRAISVIRSPKKFETPAVAA